MLISVFRRLRNDATGASALEYALVAALIAMAMITTLSVMGDRLIVFYDFAAAELERIANSS